MKSGRELIRALVPAPARLWLAVSRRAWKDVCTGAHGRMVRRPAGPPTPADTWPERVSVTQSLGHAAHLEGKRHNLALALERLQGLRLEPRSLFSFWTLVGMPSRHRGFRLGRNLVQGRLQEGEGGGLCQLSGLLYLLALRAGLRIVERHPHSVDLYTEATRYTPLGADATVVYGYRDLRFLNPHPFPLALDFSLSEDSLRGALLAPVPLALSTLEFSRHDEGAFRHVTTWRLAPGATVPERLDESRYHRAG